MSVSFTRFAETIHCKEEKRVVSITVELLLEDCTGTVYFTDIQAQEGDRLTGYTINTEPCSRNLGRIIALCLFVFITEWFVVVKQSFSLILVKPQLVLIVTFTRYRVCKQEVLSYLKELEHIRLSLKIP